MNTNDNRLNAHNEIDYIFKDLLPTRNMAERPEQVALCHRMLDAMLDGDIALCDAGTGIGKPHAYLVAGTVYSRFRAASGILNKRKHEVYKLEIDEDEARVVRMMFKLCVGSGYGRCKIANLISSQGIQTRTGGNWHEATVGHILHNITYMGVLRSGESQSEVFPELQIIDPATFELAQKLMTERVNEFNEQRTLPRNTSGQSMFSGNVFCGHCGGRLTLTTNGTVRKKADGVHVEPAQRADPAACRPRIDKTAGNGIISITTQPVGSFPEDCPQVGTGGTRTRPLGMSRRHIRPQSDDNQGLPCVRQTPDILLCKSIAKWPCAFSDGTALRNR